MKISVAFSVNDKYVEHLNVAIYSLLKNNPLPNFDIFVLCKKLSAKNQKSLQDTIKTFGNGKIEFVDLQDKQWDFNALPITIPGITVDTYFRYVLANILPKVDKLLYLDVDLLVVGDIQELWGIDLTGYYVAGVVDGFIETASHKKTIGLTEQDVYINAGVLLLNLKQLRAENIAEKLFEETRTNNKIKYQDQDVLNIVFKNKVKLLNNIFNFTTNDHHKYPEKIGDIRIIHYTGKIKPWALANPPSYAQAIYQTYAQEFHKFSENQLYSADKNSDMITVILTNYNYAKYLQTTIKSVLAQTYKSFELIIIDDGSTDDSRTIINRYKDDLRVKIVNQKNYGNAWSRSVGILLAQGKYAVYLDSDDYWDEKHLERMHLCITQTKSDIVYADSQFFGASNRKWIFPEYSLDILKNQNIISSGAMFRVSFITRNHLYWDTMLSNRVGEDWDFWLGCALKGAKITKCKETLLNYRVKSGSIMSNAGILDYLKSYNFIITKYRAMYPDEFLPYHFYGLNRRGQEYESTLEQLARIKNELQSIKMSRSYKLGKKLTAPYRKLFSIVKGRK